MRSARNVGSTGRSEVNETCDFCVCGILEEQRVTVDLRWGGKLRLIEHVPAKVGNACGERYYAASMVRQMEQLTKAGRKEPELHVPVVTLAEVTMGDPWP